MAVFAQAKDSYWHRFAGFIFTTLFGCHGINLWHNMKRTMLYLSLLVSASAPLLEIRQRSRVNVEQLIKWMYLNK